ncbi:GtrA family protein [Comamonas antarctica]|uniref:GtrA family protein n=2 Tax=Comamonas antarctica TaxID=2743470 RepID=A0A6N1X193_9BURK|nr:GtrA family protein [Comamonas antarctica]
MAMRQFAVYIGVGVACALIDIGLMQLLSRLGAHYMVATTAGFVAGLAVNFLLHAHVTFRAGYSHRALARYLVLVLANYALTLLVVSLFHAWLDMPLAGKIVSLPFVAINGYLLGKHWVYR